MDLTLTTTIDELMKTDKINGFSHQHLFKTQPFLKKEEKKNVSNRTRSFLN